MSPIDEALIQPVPVLSSVEPQKLAGKEPMTAVRSENEKYAEQPVGIPIGGSDPDVVLVEYEENDPENPLNWSPLQEWLIVSAVSWMGFVSVFSTMTITPTAPQILQEFHLHSTLDRTLLVTIWELGEGIGLFFTAQLSERFGRLPVFQLGNLLALCCCIACALSVNIPMVIGFRILTSCFLSNLTLGSAIVEDLVQMELTGLSMALVMGTQMIADFISPVAGAYIAQELGWRWSIWLAAIVLGSFSFLLLAVLRETYAGVMMGRKAERLQKQSMDNKKYRSKYPARVDVYTMLESVMKPIQILAQSPILMLTTSYVATKYALDSLIIATLTEIMESILTIGNTIALIFYSLTSDRHVIRQGKKKGDAFKSESWLVYLLLAAIILPLVFLLYGWALAFHAHHIVPLIGTCVARFSMILSTLPIETYVVDVYKIHGASAIAAGVIFRASSGGFLPLIGPPVYQSIGLCWGNTVLALIAAAFIPPLGLLIRHGDWFRNRERFASSGR